MGKASLGKASNILLGINSTPAPATKELADTQSADQEEKTGGTAVAARGQGRGRNRRVAKATPIAGQRRRTVAARQNKVWDPGRERHHDK